MFCFLTFVESANVINGAAFQTRLVEKHDNSAVDVLKSDRGYNVFQKKQSGNRLRKTHLLPDTLFHGRKHAENLKNRHKKESDSASDENKPEFNKRDFFFAPASPYGQMINPVARRMFLVHRGERGNKFSDLCVAVFYIICFVSINTSIKVTLLIDMSFIVDKYIGDDCRICLFNNELDEKYFG